MTVAINHAREVKNAVVDAGSEVRDGKFFSQRTIHSFQGRSEH